MAATVSIFLLQCCAVICLGTDRCLYTCTGAGYHVFAGREVARALALMSLSLEDCSGDLTGLSDERLAVLADWEKKFRDKGYPVVGKLQRSTQETVAD